MDIIPFKEPSQWRQEIELSSVKYVMRFRWNATNEYWSMDLLDGNEDPIVVGVKIVNNWKILDQYSMTNLPDGDIVCQSMIGEFDKIQRYDMSNKTELLYYALGEIDALTQS